MLAEKRVTIDKAFVAEWEPKYDKTEKDQQEYEDILVAVGREVSEFQCLSKPTFTRILDWKASRVKGKVDLLEFESRYAPKIRQCLTAPDGEKLSILNSLAGIGVPVGSTVLHFLYPHSFPIMDVRTVETLVHAGYLQFLQRDLKRYPQFRAVVANLTRQCSCSLRGLDRALFAYHKQYLEPEIKRRKKNC